MGSRIYGISLRLFNSKQKVEHEKRYFNAEARQPSVPHFVIVEVYALRRDNKMATRWPGRRSKSSYCSLNSS